MTTSPSIVFDRLTKLYGSAAGVRELTLQVGGGEILCFLGPNGAGKTTTIHTLMGLKNPTGGDVRVNGVSVRSPDIHGVRRRVGYLPDQPVLYDHLTGREFLQFIAELYGLGRHAEASIQEYLNRFDLSGDADLLVKDYSLGMKKKIALIAAVLPDPTVLVLDEPTGALDALSARRVKELMLEARAAGKLVFFSTHVMELAERLADRIAILHEGVLVADGTLAELRERYGAAPGEALEEIFLRLTQRGTPYQGAAG